MSAIDALRPARIAAADGRDAPGPRPPRRWEGGFVHRRLLGLAMAVLLATVASGLLGLIRTIGG